MNHEQKVIQRLEKILLIYTEAIDSLWACHYMYNPTTGRERTFIDHSNRQRFIRHVLWKNYIIEIHKLTSKSKNDDFSLIGTIDEALKSNISNSDKFTLKQYKVDLENNHEETIKMIRILRSKFYAHTDKNPAPVDVRTFKECSEFNSVIANLMKKLFLLFRDSDIDTRGTIAREGEWRDFLVLADAKNAEIQKIIDGKG